MQNIHILSYFEENKNKVTFVEDIKQANVMKECYVAPSITNYEHYQSHKQTHDASCVPIWRRNLCTSPEVTDCNGFNNTDDFYYLP